MGVDFGEGKNYLGNMSSYKITLGKVLEKWKDLFRDELKFRNYNDVQIGVDFKHIVHHCLYKEPTEFQKCK